MAVENFSTYTEVDPNSHITITDTRITAVGVMQNESAYVYYDKGANHFPGDYTHLLTTYLDDATGADNNGVVVWALANLVGTLEDIDAGSSDDEHMIFLWGSGNPYYIFVRECYGGTIAQVAYAISLDTLYYITMFRDDDVGTYGTLYENVYSDSARTTLLTTKSITLHKSVDFRYVYGMQSIDASGTGNLNAYVENLDLQEAAVSASVSPSTSPSTSPSPSVSPSSSPSVGWEGYTKGDYTVLPTNDTNLENAYSAQDYLDVNAEDVAWVEQTGQGQNIIHMFKDWVDGNTSCTLTWKGKCSKAPSDSMVYLQIYNRSGTPEWETVDSDNASVADSDFTLTANIADLTDYKANNIIACRVYQAPVVE